LRLSTERLRQERNKKRDAREMEVNPQVRIRSNPKERETSFFLITQTLTMKE
jgi:hypothetical protein